MGRWAARDAARTTAARTTSTAGSNVWDWPEENGGFPKPERRSGRSPSGRSRPISDLQHVRYRLSCLRSDDQVTHDMSNLHIAPSDSAGGSLAHALREAGQDFEVLRFRDDLSCGPIYPLDPGTRAAWWSQWYDGIEVEMALNQFRDRIAAAHDRLIIWFSRHSASEFCFFLALITWLGERPAHVIDVTGRQVPSKKRDGSTIIYQPISVSTMQADTLKSLLDREVLLAAHERREAEALWQHLQAENAPFRVVTEAGLVSTTIDYFDQVIMSQATSEWQAGARIIGNALALSSEPYKQVGDLVLQTRLVALVEQGRLLAEGDPWGRSFRIKVRSN